MKRHDLRLVIAAVAKRVRDTFQILKANQDQIVTDLKVATTRLDDLHKEITTKAEIDLHIQSAISKAIPAPAEPPKLPTMDDIVAAVIAKLQMPTAEDVAAVVLGSLDVPKGEKGDKGDAAVFVPPTTEELVAAIKSTDIIAQIVAAIPAPEKGEKGEKGESVTAEDVLKLIAIPEPIAPPSLDEITESVIKTFPVGNIVKLVNESLVLPSPEKGDKGDPGTSITIDDVRPVLEELFKKMPVPKDGTSVTIDDVLPALEGHFAKWALEFERRASDQAARALDKIEKPRDGRDGFGFEHMSVEYDGRRSFSLVFARGDEKKSFPFEVPLVLYEGVWTNAKSYQQGDCVTWDGCAWIANVKETTVRPGLPGSDDWKLAVKKGRDGRDGVMRPPPSGGTQVRVGTGSKGK